MEKASLAYRSMIEDVTQEKGPVAGSEPFERRGVSQYRRSRTELGKSQGARVLHQETGPSGRCLLRPKFFPPFIYINYDFRHSQEMENSLFGTALKFFEAERN